MSIRITNNSVSAVVRSFAIAPLDEGDTIVWLELAPQHPKVIGAIWASLVNGTREFLKLRDDESGQAYTARGLNSRYLRKTMDAPRIAGRARPKFLRLVAPAMVKLDAVTFGKKPFFAGAWRWTDSQGVSQQLAPATALAAMLDRSRQPDPAALAILAVGLRETGRRGHRAVLVPLAAFDVADPVQGMDETLGEPGAFSEDRREHVGRRLRKTRQVVVALVSEHVEHEQRILDRRAVDRHEATPGEKRETPEGALRPPVAKIDVCVNVNFLPASRRPEKGTGFPRRAGPPMGRPVRQPAAGRFDEWKARRVQHASRVSLPIRPGPS